MKNTENDTGLVKDFQMGLTKTDPALITRISEGRKLPLEHVKEIMRNNRWTFNQFADITKRNVHTITNYTRMIIMVNANPTTKIQYCLPYPDINGSGPKFIVRNENSEEFLMETLVKDGI